MKSKIVVILLVFMSMLFTACNRDTGNNKTEGNETDINQQQKDDGNVEDNTGKNSKSQNQTAPGSNKSELIPSNTNPMIWADVPDMDIIRVDNYYYMVSTTMHMTPGAPIMRSEDLLNWETVAYVYDILADDALHNLQTGDMYGRGQWAASLKYHEGTFYVCFGALETGKTYIFQTQDIEKSFWERTELNTYCHDPALFFDDDGKKYIIYGAGQLMIRELNEDLSNFKAGGVNQKFVDTRIDGKTVNPEGCHMYKINGTYYFFVIDWANVETNRRREWCFRSNTLLGEYEEKLVFDDNYGFQNSGVAQGGIVDTPEGGWYAFLFQDHGAVGRIPMLLPMTWEDNWPVIGVDGRTPETLDIVPKADKDTIVMNDEFDYTENKLGLAWQWNHNPDNSRWSVTDRPGYFRITTGSVVSNIFAARNTLTQRTEGPVCTSITKLDTRGLKPGDHAGISAFSFHYGMLGVKVAEDGSKSIIVAFNEGETGNPVEKVSVPLKQDEVYLRIEYFYNAGKGNKLMVIDNADFEYSYDGETWQKLNSTLEMQYTLDHFMGYRSALYYYSTITTGGHADFDFYQVMNSLY